MPFWCRDILDEVCKNNNTIYCNKYKSLPNSTCSSVTCPEGKQLISSTQECTNCLEECCKDISPELDLEPEPEKSDELQEPNCSNFTCKSGTETLGDITCASTSCSQSECCKEIPKEELIHGDCSGFNCKSGTTLQTNTCKSETCETDECCKKDPEDSKINYPLIIGLGLGGIFLLFIILYFFKTKQSKKINIKNPQV